MSGSGKREGALMRNLIYLVRSHILEIFGVRVCLLLLVKEIILKSCRPWPNTSENCMKILMEMRKQ